MVLVSGCHVWGGNESGWFWPALRQGSRLDREGGQEEPGVSKFSFLAERLVILYNMPDEAKAKVS